MKLLLFSAALFVPLAAVVSAEPPNVNYDEAKIPAYTLPDPLLSSDGQKISDSAAWLAKRRPELLELFRSQMHGRSPARPAAMSFEITSAESNALNGLATRKEITVHFGSEPDGATMHLLLYLPNAATKPVPVFLGVNFDGNHTIVNDPDITLAEQWTWDNKAKRENFSRPTADTRGRNTANWSVELLLKRGYAVATIPRADIEPDYPEGWRHGVRGDFLRRSVKTEFAPDDWGAIAAWAWGLSRALDYLETERAVDAKRVAVFGHSRMGKAALWAGANDERFAIVISNNSGEGGAALARRWFGETTAIINGNFPHWFCHNFKNYSGNEAKLPFDQHELIALTAPRPVYIASGSGDKWADPRGEFLAAKNAEPVYRLFEKAGLGVDDQPPVNHPVGDFIGYHLRNGPHDLTPYDWENYLAFADRHLARK